MNLLAEFLSGFRSDNRAKLAANKGDNSEPIGFFARLTAEQQAAMQAYRGGETVGDAAEAAAIGAASKQP